MTEQNPEQIALHDAEDNPERLEDFIGEPVDDVDLSDIDIEDLALDEDGDI